MEALPEVALPAEPPLVEAVTEPPVEVLPKAVLLAEPPPAEPPPAVPPEAPAAVSSGRRVLSAVITSCGRCWPTCFHPLSPSSSC